MKNKLNLVQTFIGGNESLHEIIQKRVWARAERKLLEGSK